MTFLEKATFPFRQIEFWTSVPIGVIAFFIFLPIIGENSQSMKLFSLNGFLVIVLYVVVCYFFVLVGNRHKLRKKRDGRGADNAALDL